MRKELHQKPFQKFRQTQSKNNVNALDESVGLSFNRTPVVKSSIDVSDRFLKFIIHSFSSQELASGRTATEKELSGFDLLSAVFIDRDYNGEAFEMTDYFFLEDIPCKDGKLLIELENTYNSKNIMVVYTDIFGNDFTENFELQGI